MCEYELNRLWRGPKACKEQAKAENLWWSTTESISGEILKCNLRMEKVEV